jgi:hypothetical protein
MRPEFVISLAIVFGHINGHAPAHLLRLSLVPIALASLSKALEHSFIRLYMEIR